MRTIYSITGTKYGCIISVHCVTTEECTTKIQTTRFHLPHPGRNPLHSPSQFCHYNHKFTTAIIAKPQSHNYNKILYLVISHTKYTTSQ